jgi:hypothetical protein
MTKKEKKVAKQIPKKCRYPDPAEWFAELDRLRGDQLFPGCTQLRAVGAAERNDLAVLVDGLKSDCGFFTAPPKGGLSYP